MRTDRLGRLEQALHEKARAQGASRPQFLLSDLCAGFDDQGQQLREQFVRDLVERDVNPDEPLSMSDFIYSEAGREILLLYAELTVPPEGMTFSDLACPEEGERL